MGPERMRADSVCAYRKKDAHVVVRSTQLGIAWWEETPLRPGMDLAVEDRAVGERDLVCGGLGKMRVSDSPICQK